ncbi:hypothetical protein [Azorhizobium doebereinerae]|uniref:hypothetical protein n=1 Tax=Azorhizobium doebereinerae TaxID=281091 RepID=UPI00049143F7|nr:hypothetical protein [Azorhizobium doebereinerae]
MSGDSVVINMDDERLAASKGTIVIEDGTGAVVDEDAELAGGLPKRATRNADGSVTLTLIEPVSVRVKKDGIEREDSYSEMTFHRLRGADIRAITSAAKDSQPVAMLARSTRIREAVMSHLFDQMDAEDIAGASKIVEGFFGNGPTTQE